MCTSVFYDCCSCLGRWGARGGLKERLSEGSALPKFQFPNVPKQLQLPPVPGLHKASVQGQPHSVTHTLAKYASFTGCATTFSDTYFGKVCVIPTVCHHNQRHILWQRMCHFLFCAPYRHRMCKQVFTGTNCHNLLRICCMYVHKDHMLTYMSHQPRTGRQTQMGATTV